MASPCGPLPGPPFGYLCEDELGDPVLDDLVRVDGTPAVQGPIKFCGTNEQVCVDDQVSGCMSDTDGAPTTYGPAPLSPAPSDVTGRSPRFSRLRINRVGLTPFPYSNSKRPDQLIDIVENDGTPVPWNSSTGRFTLPAAESFPDLPTAGCGLELNEDNEFDVVSDYTVARDSDALLGNATVLTAGSGRVVRLLAQPVIDNDTCRGQYIFTNVAAGFGFSPVTPDAQVRYGVLQNGVVLQEFQSQPFTAGWQYKASYLYVPSTPTPPAGFEDQYYELFAEAVNPGDQFIWVDADLGVDKWFGK